MSIRNAWRVLALSTMLVATSAIAAPPEAPKPPQAAPPSASDPDDVAYFDAFADGRTLHVLTGYGRKGSPDIRLMHRRSSDNGKTWSTPVRVNAANEVIAGHHPGENPQVAARGDRLVVIWTGPNPTGGRGGGPIESAISADGGKTWQRGANPASDDDTSYHALIDLAAGEGGFHTVWLQHGGKPPEGGGRPLPSVRHAESDDGVTWKTQNVVAEAACFCCWNRMTVGAGSDVGVLFRGGSPRDMMFARADAKGFRKPVAVGAWGWQFDGCPHVGGALARTGKSLHALVWTGDGDDTGLYLAHSTDAGDTWTMPTRVDARSATARHADLAATTDGSLVMVYDAPAADGAGSIVYRATSRDDGKAWSDAKALTAEGATAMHPRVFALGKDTVAMWLERRDDANVLVVDGKPLPAPSATKAVAAID